MNSFIAFIAKGIGIRTEYLISCNVYLSDSRIVNMDLIVFISPWLHSGNVHMLREHLAKQCGLGAEAKDVNIRMIKRLGA